VLVVYLHLGVYMLTNINCLCPLFAHADTVNKNHYLHMRMTVLRYAVVVNI
jgi:hypothetical protein